MKKIKFISTILLLPVLTTACIKSTPKNLMEKPSEKTEKTAIQQESIPEDVDVSGPEEDTEMTEVEATEETTKSEPVKQEYKILIDPGHYAGANEVVSNDKVMYYEGDYTLQIALNLQTILLEDYGITADLTRTDGNITIDGYTNQTLDQSHISLRGEMAAGYDLFISLHTNANVEGANGYPTNEQPIRINKPIILLNMVAKEDKNALNIANNVGLSITQLYQRRNLITNAEFVTKSDGDTIEEWTNEKNDALDTGGTLYIRTGTNGDYYGVLRGASNVGTPGMIIEHGHHTVPEFRKQMIEQNLAYELAKADAQGIAKGLGIEE